MYGKQLQHFQEPIGALETPQLHRMESFRKVVIVSWVYNPIEIWNCPIKILQQDQDEALTTYFQLISRTVTDK